MIHFIFYFGKTIRNSKIIRREHLSISNLIKSTMIQKVNDEYLPGYYFFKSKNVIMISFYRIQSNPMTRL